VIQGKYVQKTREECMKKKDSGKKKAGGSIGLEVAKEKDRTKEQFERPTDSDRPGPDQVLSQPPDTTEAARPGISLIQDYRIRDMLVFADAAVAKDPDQVFDVLARNFDTPGGVSWWLHKVGHGDKAQYAKGRDLVEYIRKVSHELHRDLKDIGKPKARW
jgi:hypothetical protein